LREVKIGPALGPHFGTSALSTIPLLIRSFSPPPLLVRPAKRI